MEQQRPKVIVITGISVDGKISPDKDVSSKIFDQSISNDAFMPLVELKEKADAVMVGNNTILTDDASLIGNEFYSVQNKIKRLVVDSKCKIPLTARIFNIKPERTIIATTSSASKATVEKIRKTGAEVIVSGKNKVDLKNLFAELYKTGMRSIIVEGGGKLNYSLIKERLVDELIVVLFPFAVGKTSAPSLFEGEGFEQILHKLKLNQVRLFGENIFAYYTPVY